MGLKAYQRKRDFSSTPEPRGDGKPTKSARPVFVVQKHDASRLHYDFRLEISGALASWAVPKGPSLDPKDKRLAVHVEDHPLEYGDFEGVIPRGYGAGTVMLWDRGTFEAEGDAARGVKKGKLSVTLHGEKLKGGFTLTKMRSTKDDGDNWLLIKHDDEHADPERDVLADQPTSIKTGRSLKEIAAQGASSTRKPRSKSKPKPRSSTGRKESSRLPVFVPPQLCTLTDKAPDGDDWLHEIKFDGYRLVALRGGDRVRLLTRQENDWSDRFKPIAAAVSGLPADAVILDGEACLLDAHGHTSFQDLQNAIKARRFDRLVFFAFDLLHLDGHDLRKRPLVERKAELASLLADLPEDGVIRLSDHVVGQGEAMFTNACELALEGLISKKADAPYTSGRSRTWLKVKCSRRQEFVVIGWTPPGGSRTHFGSLLLAARDGDDRLIYTGRVGTGFNARSLEDIKKRLDALARKTCPADQPPKGAEAKGANWVTPQLVAEVAFTQWTDDGRLRHPSFQGLREDKPASGVHIDEPERVNAVSTRTSNEPTVEGVRISSPDRVVFPDAGITKLELAEYYAAVGERMLPFVKDRPLSTVRCPQGRQKKCFYQKHHTDTFADPVRSIRVNEKDGKADYLAVDSVAGLVALAQYGVIEVHPWGSKKGTLDKPDQITIDLDPGGGVSWEELKTAARRVRDMLDGVGLTSYLKITGGKGLHVVAPLKPKADWDQAKAFCRAVAETLAGAYPTQYTSTASKAGRGGRIFVDYLRNSQGATSIAPYSARARPGAPVAVPVRWEDLSRIDAANAYTITTLPRRLSRLKGDPWEGYFEATQTLPSGDAIS
ncbi:MAG: DNA ligase D [Phycisphaerales bacterium]